MKGFYRSTHIVNGTEHRLAATHFEPTGARECYICQDEPSARCDFSLAVTLVEPFADMTVLSNAPLASKTSTTANGQGAVQWRFEPAKSIPPYLTACCIGDFEYAEKQNVGEHSIPLRMFCAVGKKATAEYALDVAAFALTLFEKLFRSPFPLPKLDLVAIPDFPIGGMENWGLITLTETVLVDHTKSIRSLKSASELVTHEVSHNWFGDLVAIDWWEGLWLKEGFASWCGYYGTDARHPEWLTNETDVIGEISPPVAAIAVATAKERFLFTLHTRRTAKCGVIQPNSSCELRHKTNKATIPSSSSCQVCVCWHVTGGIHRRHFFFFHSATPNITSSSGV